MSKSIEKLNWSLFVLIISICCMGAAGDESVNDFTTGGTLALIFGIGLIWAYTTREN